MNKKRIGKKNRFLIIALILFFIIFVLLFGYKVAKTTYWRIYNKDVLFTAEIRYGENSRTIRPSVVDGDIYFFLPACTEEDKSELIIDTPMIITFDGKWIWNKTKISYFEKNKEYKTKLNGCDLGNVIFMYGDNIPTVFIDTESGNMDAVNDDKSCKENADIQIINSDGSVEYRSKKMNDGIKGRGNYTWRLKKRPYNIKFSEKTSIFGFTPAKTYCLLADVIDFTKIKNYIVLRTGNEIGLEWTPKCRHIDLYFNGEYQGLYLLTEKVDIDEGKLYPNGGDTVLFEMEIESRKESADNPIVLDSGNIFDIKYPKKPSVELLDELTNYWNRLESAIYENDEAFIDANIDYDSWAKCYLINEFYVNYDIGYLSTFFYFDSDENGEKKLYCGPIWDFDNSIGTRGDAADTEKLYSREDRYFTQLLLNNGQFFQAVKSIYLNYFTEEKIARIKDEVSKEWGLIEDSIIENNCIWSELNTTINEQALHTSIFTADDVNEFIDRRAKFLDFFFQNNDFPA